MSITKDDLLSFVRRDGPLSARALFLTIEDGAGFKDRAEFDDYYGNPGGQAWEPEERLLDGRLLGKPGIYIPKLMAAMLCDDLAKWELYRSDFLYKRDCNIKYYPIARKGTNEWPEWLCDVVARDEYERACHSRRRRDAISAAHGAAFSPDKLIVILGACDEWRTYLDEKVFPTQAITSLGDAIPAARGRIVGDTFGCDGEFRYCYFDMFRPGIADPEILEFAARVRSRAGHLLDGLEFPC